MPDGKSALSRLNSRTHINEEAERGLLADPIPEPEPEASTAPAEITTSVPTLVAATRPRRAGKQSSFENLAASITPVEQVVPFSVRIPLWLRQAVVERIKTQQAKGVKLTQDMVAKQALMSFFDLEEPK
jgi:hypothetical protein